MSKLMHSAMSTTSQFKFYALWVGSCLDFCRFGRVIFADPSSPIAVHQREGWSYPHGGLEIITYLFAATEI